jgi:tetratricopeptide (TPR) repeat protein
MPERGRFYFNRATEYFYLKKYESAIEDFTVAIEKMEDPFEAYYFRGKLYFETGVYDKAVNDLKTARKINPDDRRALDLLFPAQVVLFLSRYWLFVIGIALLLINGMRLYRRDKVFR